MLQPLQLQEVANRYPREIEEVRDFLVKSGFTLGTATSLGTVTARLRQDRTLRRDLTSHVWVVLHTAHATYSELLALVTLAVAGLQFAATADEDEAHEMLRFLMGARGAFEGSAPVAQPAPLIVPVVAAPVVEAPAMAPLAAPVAEVPFVVPVAAPIVAQPVAPTLSTPAPKTPVERAPLAGNLRPMRVPGDLPPLRWSSSANDSDDDEPEESERTSVVLATILCLLAVVLFGIAIWRYQWAKVHEQQQQTPAAQTTPAQAGPSTGAATPTAK